MALIYRFTQALGRRSERQEEKELKLRLARGHCVGLQGWDADVSAPIHASGSEGALLAYPGQVVSISVRCWLEI